MEKIKLAQPLMGKNTSQIIECHYPKTESCAQCKRLFMVFHRFNFKPEFVVVAERLNDETAEMLELPLDTVDNTLGLPTLTRAFPGAHGLKYKNPVTGALRALL